MMQDPQRVKQLLNIASKALWLVIASVFGSMVGHLILLYVRQAGAS
jgi:hypothetical protein